MYNIAPSAQLELAYSGDFDKPISGAGDLIIYSPGTLQLASQATVANDYDAFTGMLTIQRGTFDIQDNTFANPAGLTMYGGTALKMSGGSIQLTGEKLNIEASNGQSARIEGNLEAPNAEMNFIGRGGSAGPLLSVTGTANVDNSRFRVALAGSYHLIPGFRMTLIDAQQGISAQNVSRITDNAGTVTIGSTIAGNITNSVIEDISAQRLDVIITASASNPAKTLLEGNLAGLALTMQGGDLVASRGIGAALQATHDVEDVVYTPFATVSGGYLRYNTGSHIDMRSLNLMTGFAAGIPAPSGRFTAGLFFEYGTGAYNTYNSFASGSFDGDGSTSYMGGGMLARMDWKDLGPGHFYLEGSGRMGSLYNDYTNDDLKDAWGRRASYDTCTPYYSFHAGLGYIWDFADKGTLDFYAKYFWTRVEGDSVQLSTGEQVEFEDMYSSRFRAGVRLGYEFNEYVSGYGGIAGETELNGRAMGTTNGYDISSPDLQGDTGIGELGLVLKPSPSIPLSIDLAVQGHVGRREGITGSALVTWTF